MEASERISFKGIGEVLKLPAVWIIAFVTFCNYVFTLSLYYFTPYATSILGATVTFAATLAAMKRWFSLFGNVGGGFITDKVGTGKNVTDLLYRYGCRYSGNRTPSDKCRKYHCSLQFCLL